jgi:ferritin-like metal-binding protein YciE
MLCKVETNMTGQTARDLLVAGLREAHAMETQARELMERQSERTGDFPEVQRMLRRHLEETKQQMRRLEDCLSRLGESESNFKDAVMSVAANISAMTQSMASDAIIKNTLANSAFEHYEIAAYKSLLAMCREANVDLSGPLSASLREEEAMAEWVDSHVEDVTRQYVARKSHAAAAV